VRRLAFLLLCVSWIQPLPAQENGIDQSLELYSFPEGGKLIVWYGYVGRSYFVQVSDPNDPLKKWTWAPIIEGGNDEEISHEVEGTADKGFFRLQYTDQVPGPNEDLDTADFDGDGISNKNEIEPGGSLAQTDPLNPDTDGDGLPDGWERTNGLDPNDATGVNGAGGDPDNDGLTNLQEYLLGTSPTVVDNPGILQDAITNGDFSLPLLGTGLLADTTWDYWAGVPGWRAVVGQNIEYQNIEPIATGNQYAELKAHPEGHYGIKQRVGTRTGIAYLLVLDCAARHDTTADNNCLSIKINGETARTITFETVGQWATHAVTFIASSVLTEISLVPDINPNDTMGCLVDNVKLMPMDLDIIHPATGEVAEMDEDSSSGFVEEDKGGLVAIRRNENTPLTMLVLRELSNLPLYAKYRLKVNSTHSSGHVQIWRDHACTQLVTSEQTEFDVNTATTVFLEGVNEGTGDDLKIFQQIKVDDLWNDGDVVSIKVVHAEIPVVLRAFIPHAWTAGEIPVPMQLLPPAFSNTVGGDRQDFSREGYDAEPAFRLAQTVIMTPYRELHADIDIASERRAKAALLSKYYDRTEDVPVADQGLNFGEAFVDGATPNWEFPPDSSPEATYDNAWRAGKITCITVSLSGGAGTPEFLPDAFIPNIDYQYVIKMERMEIGCNPYIRVTMDVIHNLYPSYEAIAGKADASYVSVYQNSPLPEILPGPNSLTTSMEGKGGPIDLH